MVLIDPLRRIVLDYLAEWQLVPWLRFDEINWWNLACNPHPAAFELMLAYPGEARMWGYTSAHAHAWPYLRECPGLIDLEFLAMNEDPDAVAYYVAHRSSNRHSFSFSRNPSAIPWLRAHPEMIHEDGICENPSPEAKELLPAHLEGRHWLHIHANPAPWAIAMIEANPDKYERTLAGNPAGFDILLRRAKERGVDIAELCHWQYLCRNPDPRAVALAMTRPDDIHWRDFSTNPGAIAHFKTREMWVHIQKRVRVFENPGIFELRWPDGLEAALAAALA
jgi:hypothetical protein